MDNQNSNKLSIKKYIFLVFITFGIYNISWIYQTWKRIKQETKKEISAFWRTVGMIVPILNLVLIYKLFKNVVDLAKKAKLEIKYTAWSLLAVLVGLSAGYRAFSNTIAEEYWVLSIIGVLFASIAFFLTQDIFNKYWEKIHQESEKKGFSRAQIIWIAIGILIWILAIYANFFLN